MRGRLESRFTTDRRWLGAEKAEEDNQAKKPDSGDTYSKTKKEERKNLLARPPTYLSMHLDACRILPIGRGSQLKGQRATGLLDGDRN
ncbi:hypothetical protein L249_2514, partial [Ophiocordyceps polyrhachis-furcata BCC 54312]